MVRIVQVLAHNPGWSKAYSQEVQRLQAALDPLQITFHHIGSTSIPGLAAKPTIDMLGVVEDLAELDDRGQLLSDLGYEAKGENGIPGRRYFRKLAGEVHLFHIHAFEVGHPEIQRHLDFRDYLRAHPKDAAAYQELKFALSKKYPLDPISYTNGKTDFILSIDQKAAAWRTANKNKLRNRE